MPAKSRHAKGKHLHQSKKSKSKQRQKALTTKTAATEQPARITELDNTPSPRPAIVTSRPRTTDYPYITGELLRIGVVAGVIFIILIVLALTIP
jgi:hypothetical protein